MDAAPPPEPNPYEPPRVPTRRAGPPPGRPMSLIEVACVASLLVVACGIAFVATCVPLGVAFYGIYGRFRGTWRDAIPWVSGGLAALGLALLLGRYWFGPTSPFRSGPPPPDPDDRPSAEPR